MTYFLHHHQSYNLLWHSHQPYSSTVKFYLLISPLSEIFPSWVIELNCSPLLLLLLNYQLFDSFLIGFINNIFVYRYDLIYLINFFILCIKFIFKNIINSFCFRRPLILCFENGLIRIVNSKFKTFRSTWSNVRAFCKFLLDLLN